MNPLLRQPGRRVARGLALLACAMPLCASPAGHPVQKCIVDGAIVFQSAPCLREAAPAAAPAAATVNVNASASVARNPGPEAPRKRKTLAETLREHDAGDRGAAPGPATAGDGYKVLKDRMGAH